MCITGVNGAGKTTLIKVILGLLEPESGKVNFKQGKNIAYVSQSTSDINKALPITVEELVSLSLIKEKKLSKKEKKERINDALGSMDILHIKHKKIGELSGGQRQRVYIAKALLNKTNCIILDEPTASIDKKSVGDICCLLGELNKAGLTVIMITHDVHSIINHATKVLNFVDKNKVIEQTPQSYIEMGIKSES